MTTTGCLIEKRCRLSESHLWAMNRNFFDREGVAAWQQGVVPSYITTNAFMARAYAQVILRFLLDCKDEVAPDQPVTLLELGAATGKFGYLVLKQLERLRAVSDLKLPPYRMILSDCSEGNLAFARQHPYLEPYVRAGLVDFAFFDAEASSELHLLHSGETLGPGTMKSPLFVLANYVFDGIRYDAYRCQGGELNELLITLSSSRAEEPDPTDPGLLGRVKMTFDPEPVGRGRYEDKLLDAVLNAYRQLDRTTFLMPVGPVQCLKNLHALANGKLFILCADKGFNDAQDLLGNQDLTIAVHGSFSVSTNLHALGLYAEGMGGTALHAPRSVGRLVLSAILFGDKARYASTRLSFEETMCHHSPLDVYEVSRGIGEGRLQLNPPALLALLRLGACDPDLLLKHGPALEPHLSAAASNDARRLRDILAEIVDNVYPVGDGKDPAFAIARLLHGIGYFKLALSCLRQSDAQYPGRSSTHYQMGLTQLALGDRAAALHEMEAALQIDGSLASALAWRLQLAEVLGRG